MVSWELFAALLEAIKISDTNRDENNAYKTVYVYGMHGQFIICDYIPEVRSYYEVNPYGVREFIYQGFGEVTTEYHSLTVEG